MAGCTLHSDNCGTFTSDNGGTGDLCKITSSKLEKLIQPVLILLVGHTHRSDNDSALSSHNGGTGHLSKVTNCKLKKLIQPALIQLVVCTLHSDNGGILAQIMVVLDVTLKSLVVS